MQNFQFGFWNHNSFSQLNSRIFGCRSHGISTSSRYYEPGEIGKVLWDKELKGEVLLGTFQKVLTSLPYLNFKPKLCIALFNKGLRVEVFLNQLIKVLPRVPVIGGVAATFEGGLLHESLFFGNEVSVLFLSEGDFKIESLNIYNETNIAVEVNPKYEREFDLLRILPGGDWQNALDFYRNQQFIFKVDEGNFEQITFCDRFGRNIHCSTDGTRLQTGANLPEDNMLYLRTITYQEAELKLAVFMASENSLIFGCAGIRSLLNKPVYTGKNSLMGFMFGELVILNDLPMFGNLMLTKLRMF